MTKLQDKEDMGKYFDRELQEAKCRMDVVTYSLMSEAQHFHQHRVTDFRDYIQSYLSAQVEFHKMVSSYHFFIIQKFSHLSLFSAGFVLRVQKSCSAMEFRS